ncbi:VWA domain-containing protein [Conexibacter sp. DBS9H8]|uniref:VWA domain-containing protein n=1 Tax=Conexibacter sp. DBS9H8 TaxID=2937801 RepID=UPI00200DBA23|nr:VWA domain-containing protein [Conexibacter sp. DBS9H8]
MSATFPLSAVVGQADLVEALLICAVAPDVGGVLIRGERGNAKSTAVRGLAELLHPAPLVEVPLGATLDRLVGSLDVGHALAGEFAVSRGLLGRAHQGLLYVDEVNLLADHLVDVMLDAAASGVVRVERDGVSVTEEARFTLIGTMNVEEGELRPQLLDRFGLGVEVRTPADPSERAEIVRRRLRFEADPNRFCAEWAEADRALGQRVAAARDHYPSVVLGERELLSITTACAALGADGVRGDLVTARAARALAALDGADTVGADHVRRAGRLALAHRLRRDPLDPRGSDPEQLERAFAGAGDEPDPDPENGRAPEVDGSPGAAETAAGPPSGPRPDGPTPGADATPEGEGGPAASPAGDEPTGAPTGESFTPGAEGPASEAPPSPAPERRATPVPARFPAAATARARRRPGPSAGSVDTRAADGGDDDLAVVASLLHRRLRRHVRSGPDLRLLCLVLDASGSMGARRRAARVKGALMHLLADAYARRDRVAVIAFRDASAQLLVPPGAPLEAAAEALRGLPTGGRTPLGAGLQAAADVIRREAMREPERASLALVITDGRVPDPDGTIAAAAAGLGRVADSVSVIDTEDGVVRLGLAERIARAAGGQRYGFAA